MKSRQRNGAGPLVGKATGAVKEWLDRHGARDWLSAASRQRSTLLREVRHLGEEIIDKIAGAPFFAQREQLIHEVRHHLESIIDQLSHSSLISKAMDTARVTRKEILSFLNVPSQQELKKLQQRLNKIETRLGPRAKSAGAAAELPTQ